jgi:class 3 adenylate cyclase
MSDRDWIAAGLYDPDAPDADERRALLEYLAGLGLAAGDISEAACGGGLGQLAADRVLFGDSGPTMSVQDAAARGGFDEASLRRIVRASGLADPGDAPVFRDADVELFDAFAAGAAIFGEDATLQFTRVLGSAAARVAEAAVSLFFTNVSPRFRMQGLSDLDTVRQSADAVSAFGGVPHALDILLREHFTAAVRRMGLLGIAEGGTTAVAIGFVDLADSTDLTRHTGPAELTAALSVFEYTAQDAAVARDCRVVKMIGDEAMFAGADAATVLDVVNEVLAAVEQHAVLGSGRAGIASGDAVSRDGDYFGPVVNLAARLVGAARSGEVLVNADAATAVQARGYRVDDAGEYELKGFDEAVPAFRVTR